MLSKLVEYIAKRLVNNPDRVKVEEDLSNNVVLLKLKVDSADLGKVIGKSGKMARAIRTLVHVAAIKDKKRAVVEILD